MKASPMQTEKPRLLRVLEWLSAISLVVALYLTFFYAPREAVMGEVQRVFYFHVASGWLGMLAFILAALAGIAYLVKRDMRWDVLAVACVEIGLVYAFINTASGSIWARPAWNTWWTWDPRLVTSTIMILVYVAYSMLRQGLEDPEQRARFGAVYSLVAAVTVPLTYYSIRIWRTLHPVVIGSGSPTAEGGFDMTSRMLVVFLFSLLTFTFLGTTLIWHRYRLGQLNEHVEQLRVDLQA